MSNNLFRWLLIIAALAAVICFASCSTTSKNKTVSRIRVDSMASARVDSTAGGRIDSSGVSTTIIEVAGNYERETTYVYRDRTDTVRVIQTLTIRERGNNASRTVIHDSVRVYRVDTITVIREAQVAVKRDEQVKTKAVRRVSYWGWLWIILALVAGYCIYRAWPYIRRYIGV